VSAIVADHILAILGLAFLIAAGTVAWVMHSPRKFTASVTVAPVGNARQLNIPSSIAGSLLGSMNSGIQATPVFVARLARLRNVLDAVARRTVPGRQQTIIEGVMRRPLAEIDAYKFPMELDKQLQTSIDRESGTVTFAAALADSALARAIVNALVEGVSATYTRAMKSQAGALVEAQARESTLPPSACGRPVRRWSASVGQSRRRDDVAPVGRAATSAGESQHRRTFTRRRLQN
jgi:hypothetical protein